MSDQRVFPMIAYEDAARAVGWLCTAFGFGEDRAQRHTGPDGRITHAQLTVDGGSVMVAQGENGYQGPDRHAEGCAPARRWLDTPYIVDGILVYVDDVRAHFEAARAAGARILSEIEEGGPGVRYRAADCEGHRWMFMQKG